MYVAVKGGERAIDNAHRCMQQKRRGDLSIPELSVKQIAAQLPLAVDRVMTEASLYDVELAALAIKQASGDLIEAIFLLRAYRTTLPRFADSLPIDTAAMRVERRISAIFKDVPGGQLLGPTYDYSHRLLDFSLLAEQANPAIEMKASSTARLSECPPVSQCLQAQDLLERPSPAEKKATAPDVDITRTSLEFPCNRAARLQTLARGDEGFLLALGYSTQRGYGRNHPFAGEIRSGKVGISVIPEELGFEIEIGEITVTECDMVNQFVGSKTKPPQFTRGYGLSFGFAERKAMAMALVDRALRADEFGEMRETPAQDEEFVLAHADNVAAVGFVSHLKLPHYVDFQAELELVRRMRDSDAKNIRGNREDAA